MMRFSKSFKRALVIILVAGLAAVLLHDLPKFIGRTEIGDVQTAKMLPILSGEFANLAEAGDLSYALNRNSRTYVYVVSGISNAARMTAFCKSHGIDYSEHFKYSGATNIKEVWGSGKFNDHIVLDFPDDSFSGMGGGPRIGQVEIFFRYSDNRFTACIWGHRTVKGESEVPWDKWENW